MAKRSSNADTAGCLVSLLVLAVFAYELAVAAVNAALTALPYAVGIALVLVAAQVVLLRWRRFDLFRTLRSRLVDPFLAWRRHRTPPVVIDAWSSGPAPAVREYISPRMRFDVLQRDGFRCRYCGRSSQGDGVRLEVDHLVPVSRGGPTTPDNLVTACFHCNRSKHARAIIDYP
jgi:hypothetical protein